MAGPLITLTGIILMVIGADLHAGVGFTLIGFLVFVVGVLVLVLGIRNRRESH